MWKVIRNHIGFVVPPSVIVRQTYVFQLEEKVRNQSRNGYPRFTAPYFAFCLVLFGSCSFFRSAYVISKVFFRAFNTAKGYIDEEAKWENFLWISGNQFFTFRKEQRYSASFVSQELKSTVNEHLQVLFTVTDQILWKRHMSKFLCITLASYRKFVSLRV